MSLPDQAIRDEARSKLLRSYLIEAGAGTGKTTLIVDRIANLVESGVDLKSIVAITFTEKAAGELKLRVRQALEQRSADPRAKAALSTIERASISTIHAWCASLLRSHPVEAGVDPLFAVLDATASHALFERTWEEWLGRELSETSRPPIVEIPGKTADWWIRELQGLAKFLIHERAIAARALPEVRGGDPTAKLMEFFSQTDFGAYADGCKNPSDRMREALEKSRVAREEFLRKQPDGRLADLYGQKGLFTVKYGNWGAKTNWVGGKLDAARDLMAGAVDLWQEARASAMHDLCARVVRWLAEGFVPAYEAEKAAIGALDFDDLLVKLAALLRNHAEVRREVRRSVRHLIIDEFQDTDPVQCEAAFLLTAEHDTSDWRQAVPRPGALFLVGDPKQSIYGFRGADIETYSIARERMDAAGSLLPISANFRSRPPILEWVNAVFSKLIVPDPGGARYQAAYAPLLPPGDTPPAPPCVHLLRPPKDAVYPLVSQSRDAESRTVAAMLRDRIVGKLPVRDRRASGASEERPARLGDVVILLRNRTSSLPAYERAMRAANIPYVVVGGRALWERQEVRALAALCASVENPFDAVSTVAALKSPFFGASDAELLLWKDAHGRFALPSDAPATGTVGEALTRIREWHRDRLQVPPYRLLDRILVETGALAAFGLKPDGAQRVANLLRLVESAREFGDAFGKPGTPPSFRAFVQGLSEKVRELRDEAEGVILEEEGDAVRIMTMHASKGLEFPVVVLGDLAVADGFKEPRYVDPETNLFAFRIGNEELGLETLGYDEAKARIKAREDAEAYRLLYVAATRARDALILPLFAPAKRRGFFYEKLTQAFPDLLTAEDTLAPAQGGPAALVPGLAPVTGDPPIYRLDAAEMAAALDALAPSRPVEDVEARAQLERISARRQPRRIASVTHLGATPAPPVQLGLDYRLAPEDARRVGTAVHHALEVMELGDADGIARAAIAEARALGIADAAVLAHAEKLARNAAALPYVERARRSPRVLREWPFLVKGDGWLLEGIVDLAWIERDGLVVLDYKTDVVGGAGEGIPAAVEHHRPQLLAYSWALSSLTGLPVTHTVLAFLAVPAEHEEPVTRHALEEAGRAVEEGMASAKSSVSTAG